MRKGKILIMVIFVISILTSCSGGSGQSVSVNLEPEDGTVFQTDFKGTRLVTMRADVSGVNNGYFWKAELKGADKVWTWSGFYPSGNFSTVQNLQYGKYTLEFSIRTPFSDNPVQVVSTFWVNSSPRVYDIAVYNGDTPVESNFVEYTPGLRLKFSWKSEDVDGVISKRYFHMVFIDSSGVEKSNVMELDKDSFVWLVPDKGELTWWIVVRDDKGGEYESARKKLYIY